MAPTEILACAARGQTCAAAAAVRHGARSGLRQPERARAQRGGARNLASGEAARCGRNARVAHQGVDFDRLGLGDHRRTASFRRRAARASARQGDFAAHAAHDGDADSANARAIGLRRSRPFGHRRASARTDADRNVRGSNEPARTASTSSCARTSREDVKPTSSRPRSRKAKTRSRAPSPRPSGCERDVFPDLRLGLLHGRLARARKRGDHEPLRPRRARRAGLDDRRRSRRRRRQRDA